MGTPAAPTVETVGPTLTTFELSIELSRADVDALMASGDARKEVGSVTPDGFTNAQKITLSRLAQVASP